MEQSLVGYAIELTLTNDVTVKGTVLTYVPARELLVLMKNPCGDTQSITMIRTNFIKSFNLIDYNKTPDDQKLPPNLEMNEKLPAVNAKVATHPKAMKFLATESRERSTILEKSLCEAPLGAVEIFYEMARILNPGQVKWDPDTKQITGNGVVIEAKSSWRQPSATIIDGSQQGRDNIGRMDSIMKKVIGNWPPQ